MGLTLRGGYKESPSYSMGYITFGHLRQDIADYISKDYGKYYSALYDPYLDVDTVEMILSKVARREHFGQRLLAFFQESDVDGKLSPVKCKVLLEKIRDMENQVLYGYTAYPKDCMTIGDFKRLLWECWKRRSYLRWS